ncbi:hypothetical protein LRS05_02845 [Flavobacterium sp. J372]|uniref:hypothetical protein n=1 Tax=Flavobacterium sp. J372 TaxID=2898436 RepID=UPI002150F969|nr:hypothetical protein [Flavobacterium sp. J372]MCR5861147.1 hypothetical protein [Flavobacterium sp. J372]
MKKIFILCSFLFFITATAQTTFQKGYFVTKTNQQTECLIKNYDWNRIPTEIEYKTDESAEVKKIYTSQLQSFYIEGTSHMYKEYDVPAIPEQKGNIAIKSGKQLLKVIAEGKASLLKNGDDIYFLHFEGQPVKPLIYTRYLSTATGREETDNSFRLELYNSLKCETVGDIRKIKYNENQLLGVITRYNECQDSETVNYAERKTMADFNLRVVTGINFYTSKIDVLLERFGVGGSGYDQISLEGDAETNILLGFEAEIRLPFNHKKWALFTTPTYNSQGEISQYIKAYDADLKITGYSYVEMPLGIRHYFILNKNSELNLDIAYGFNTVIGSKPTATYTRNNNILNIDYKNANSGSSLLRVGFGYIYKNYSAGINYYAKKSLTHSNTNGSISVLLGYKIL